MILDRVVLSDVSRGPSTESARVTLLRRNDADFGVCCAEHMRSAERFFSIAADGAESNGGHHETCRNDGQHRGREDQYEKSLPP